MNPISKTPLCTGMDTNTISQQAIDKAAKEYGVKTIGCKIPWEQEQIGWKRESFLAGVNWILKEMKLK